MKSWTNCGPECARLRNYIYNVANLGSVSAIYARNTFSPETVSIKQIDAVKETTKNGNRKNYVPLTAGVLGTFGECLAKLAL